jgi:uncharacterized protein (DUF1330 family)
LKTQLKIALSILAGIALGATVVQGIHAQDEIVPTYYIAEVEVTNLDGYVNDYLPRAEADIKASGGRILASGAKVATIEGEPPKSHLLVLAWDDIDKMQVWRSAPKSREIEAIGHKYARFRAFTVEGLPQSQRPDRR